MTAGGYQDTHVQPNELDILDSMPYLSLESNEAADELTRSEQNLSVESAEGPENDS